MREIRMRKILKMCIALIVVTLVGIVLYGAYITGGYVKFPDVFYAVTCSLMSFNGKYFTRIAVTFDNSLFKIGSENLRGFAFIYILTPSDILVKVYRLDHPMTVCLDLSSAIKDVENHVKTRILSLSFLGSHIVRVVLPGLASDRSPLSIWITLYMYDRHGNLYVGALSYGPYDYLSGKGLAPLDAYVLALKTPLIMLRQPLWIVVTRRRVGYMNATQLFDYAINVVSRELYNRTVQQLLKYNTLINANSDPVLRYVLHRLEAAGCRPAFVKVYWTWLYNARNSTPPGWLRHIQHLSTSKKKFLWKLLATYFSLAYFFPANKYDPYHIISCFESIVPSAVMPMSSFIGWLLYGHPLSITVWNDVLRPGKHIRIEVPLGVKVRYLGKKPAPIRIDLYLYGIGTVTKYGITLLGRVITGGELLTGIALGIVPISVDWYFKYRQSYFEIPVELEYIHDGIIVQYYITKYRYIATGKTYWTVIPVVLPIPILKIRDIDLGHIRVVTQIPSTYLSNLLYLKNMKYILTRNLTIPKITNLTTAVTVYNDTNNRSWFNSDTYSYLMTNIPLNITEKLLNSTVGVLLSRKFLDMETMLVTYTYINTKDAGMLVQLYAEPEDAINRTIIMQVYKYVPRSYVLITINGHTYVPLAYTYLIVVKPESTNQTTSIVQVH